MWINCKRIPALFLLLVLRSLASAQGGASGAASTRDSYDFPSLLKAAQQFSTADIVVLKEKTNFHFFGSDNEKIVKTVLLKVNTEKGVKELLNYRLPESFDPTYDGRLGSNGQLSLTQAPYTSEFNLRAFSSRKYNGTGWVDAPFNQNYESYRRPGGFGPMLKEEQVRLTITTVGVGDILELHYEGDFVTYGSNLFYFHGAYPKVDCEYAFIYKIPAKLRDYEFTMPVNIADSLITRSSQPAGDYIKITSRIRVTNINKVNYPSNVQQANRLPHVYADFTYYRSVMRMYPRPMAMRPKKFEWKVYNDTAEMLSRENPRQIMAIRRFLNAMPRSVDDSARFVFLRSLGDSFNDFRYLSPRQLYLNESYSASTLSADYLFKRQLPATYLTSLLSDIFREQNIFYFSVNVLDKRYGDQNPKFRAHYAYEHQLFALPVRGGFLYLMPRYNGVKYFLNELPFYFEDAIGAFTGRNFQEETQDKAENHFKIEKLPTSSFNQNVRSEHALVNVSADSSRLTILTKENLSGQFSTLLRHLYLNEGIDSTVQGKYFKKCTDKPGVLESNSRLMLGTNEYPFKYSFSCETKIPFPSHDTLDISGWFSVPFAKDLVPEAPTQDYYFDFLFTDVYNFVFEFGRKTEIVNRSDFSQRINNEFYSFESEIVPNNEAAYQLRAKLVIKKSMLPKEYGYLLVELGEQMSRLNSFKLVLKPGV